MGEMTLAAFFTVTTDWIGAVCSIVVAAGVVFAFAEYRSQKNEARAADIDLKVTWWFVEHPSHAATPREIAGQLGNTPDEITRSMMRLSSAGKLRTDDGQLFQPNRATPQNNLPSRFGGGR
jgi:hypothetical protein